MVVGTDKAARRDIFFICLQLPVRAYRQREREVGWEWKTTVPRAGGTSGKDDAFSACCSLGSGVGVNDPQDNKLILRRSVV